MYLKRNRILYLVLIIFTIPLGLMSRASFVPTSVLPYLGDILYTLLFYFIFAFLFPEMPKAKVAAISIGLCFLIEVSQFYQADWINEIRSNKLGGLILGFGFRWSDLVCYTLGGLWGYALETYGPLAKSIQKS
ncbi:MAG: DUF2809 domain-containing protein [Bacteroidota bacterium]